MRAIRCYLTITIGAMLLFGITACDREITRIEQVTQDPSTCFDCHSDENTILVAAEQQWFNSKHASGLNTNRNFPPCSGCHVSEGFLARVAGDSPGTYSNPTSIHCFTCHAPHSLGDFSLRVTAEQSLMNGASFDLGAGNLCVFCHQARRNVNSYVGSGQVTFTSEHWGPHHSTQGDLVIGSNGYEYDGFTYEQLEYHRTLTDDGCVDCHFKSTQNYVVGGHSFNMEAELEGEEVLNLGTCNKCHDELEDFNYDEVQDDVTAMTATLKTLLVNAGLIDDSSHTIEDVTTSADSAGAVWNYLLVYEDRSKGVHNSKYALGLLESSILFMEGDLPQKEAPQSLSYGEWALPKLSYRR
jgi:hypothetical protein